MAKLGEIDIYGTLNAATMEGIIAKAEQIKVLLPFETDGKDYTTLAQYLNQQVMFKRGEEIAEWITNEKNTTPAFFICISEQGVFKKGHFIYYPGEANKYEDLTPSGGGTGSSDRPILTVNTIIKSEYATNENITINYSWTSQNSGAGRVYGILDGTTKLSRRENPMNESGENSRDWEIGQLSRGKHNIELYVNDSKSLQSDRYRATIVVGGLEIQSDFNQSNFYLAGKELNVPFTILDTSSNRIEVEAQLDDGDIFNPQNENSLVLSGEQMTDKVHKLKLVAKGYDPETGELKATSNELILTIIAAVEGKVYVTPYSNSAENGGIENIKVEEKQQVRLAVNIVEINGKNYVVKYWLIKKGTDTRTQIHQVVSTVGIVSTSISFDTAGEYTLVVEATSASGNVGSTSFNCTIDRSSLLSVNPITDGAQLILDAKGKTNNDIDKEKWLDKSGNNINVSLKDFNYKTNGWVMSEDGISKNYLLINSRAYVEIDLEPFINDIDKGLTVDVEFETRDVSNVNARVISCYGAPIGFFCDTSTARLGSSTSPSEVTYTDKTNSDGTITTIKTGPFEVNFRQGVKTHLTFCIYKYDNSLGSNNIYPFSCMTMYVNGVMSGIQELTSNDDFQANKWQKIYLGCSPVQDSIKPTIGATEFENFGEAKIYNLRVYNRALTDTEIVTNYVADIEDLEEKDFKVRSNKLGEAATDTTMIIPEMNFSMFESDYKGITKSAKQKAIITYTSPSGSLQSLDSFGTVQWQGTSTLAYAIKNFKIFLYDRNDLSNVSKEFPDLNAQDATKKLYENLKLYGKKNKVDIGNGITSNKFTLKADYMDSSLSHNTATGMFVNDLGTEETPPQEYISAARTAIYGFPMRLNVNLVPDTEIDGSGLPIEASGTKESLGIFNFNLDKGSTDALGLYEKDDIISELGNSDKEKFLEEYPNFDTLSFEISANSDSSAGAFAVSDYKGIITDFEYRFPDEDDIDETRYYGDYIIDGDNLTIDVNHKFKYNDDGTVRLTKYVSNNLISGTYTKSGNDYKSASWTLKASADGKYVIENYLNYDENTNEVVESKLEFTFVPSETEANKGYVLFIESRGQSYMNSRVHLKRLIDWVLDADDETFYNDFEKHFNLSAVLDYYLLVMTLGMVDNLGKNMMLDTYGPVKKGRTFSVGANRGSQITYTEEERAKYDDYAWYPHFYDMD